MQLLGDPSVWLVFSFAILLGMIWKKGRGAILGVLDKRIETIKQEIQEAENLRTEAQELLAQYQRKHRDAVKEAEKIIESAERQASEMKKKAEQDLSEMIARREAQMHDRMQRMQQNAVAEIQKYAADLAIKATAEIIADKLDKAANDKLIDQAIKDIGKKFH